MIKRPFAWLGSFLRSVVHQPIALGALGLGVLIGVIVDLPLFPAVMPDSVATLIGSAVGAFIAVSGAAWVAGQKERSEAAALRISVEIALNDCLRSARDGIDMLALLKFEEIPDKTTTALSHIQCEVGKSSTRLNSLRPGVARHPVYLLQLFHVEECLKELASLAGAQKSGYINAASAYPIKMDEDNSFEVPDEHDALAYRHSLYWVTRSKDVLLIEAYENLRRSIGELGAARVVNRVS